MAQHYPVLLAETLEYLAIRPNGFYLDCTAGLGGHTRAIASRLTDGGRLVSNDRDPQSLEMARQNAAEFADRIEFQHAEFSELRSHRPGRAGGGSGSEPVSTDGPGDGDFHFNRTGRWTCAWIKRVGLQRPTW